MTRDIFTAREHAIARMVVEGYDNKDIGRQLNKSTNMVKNLMRPMYTKSGMSSRLELALWYLHHFSKTLALVVLLGALGAAQVTAPTTKPIAASDFGRWTIPAATTVPSAGTFTVQLQFSLATATSGPSFSPVTNGALLLIIDQGNNETVVPSSVNCPMGGVTCTFIATFLRSHRGNFLVSSGTFGLQEAVNYLQGNNGGTVQLTTDWPGNSSTITAITGSTNVSIQDIRNGLTLYTWNGSAYTTPVTNTFNCGTTANPGIPFWNGTACLVDTNATLDGNGNMNLVTITASGAITGLTVGTTGNGGVFSGTTQTAPGTPGVNQYALYVDSVTGNLTCINHALGNCMPSSGGGGATLQTNGVNNTSQASLNMVNPANFNGLTFTFSNPSGGNETFTVGGLLDLATQTNHSTIINGVSCSLGPSGCSISAGGTSAIEAWDGDGSDGAVTADGSTTVTCLGAPAANVYTMTRDCYFTTLTINTGVTIKTASNRLLATVSITSSGTIQNAGTAAGGGTTATGTNKATGGTGGSNSSTLGAGSLGAPFPGFTGKTGANGSTGVGAAGVAGTAAGSNGTTLSGLSGNAGAAGGNGGSSGASGGNNAGGTGGTAGTAGTSGLSKSSPREVPRAATLYDAPGNTYEPVASNGGSASGASGGGDGVNSGGGGGGSGGIGGFGGFVVLISPTITLNGASIINVSGGTGGVGGAGGTPTTGNCGGGGGGAGGDGGNAGIIVRIYNTLTNNGTDNVNGGTAGNGGAAGSGVGTGANGTAGANGTTGIAGLIYNLQLP